MQIKTTTKNLENYKNYLKVMQATHAYLQSQMYLPIELPVLSPVLVPESYLEVFETEFRFLQKREKLYLTPSPELFLKRLLAHDIGDCYYLGKSFRNSEPESERHSPEFMMLEFYKMHANYMDIADELLKLLSAIAQSFTGTYAITYQGKKISFEKWEKISVSEAFLRFAGIESDELFHQDKLISKAADKGYNTKGFSYEDIFSQIYTQEIEPQLGKNGFPTLLYDYPKEFAALAKLNPDGKTAQRFEFYIQGIELGDCYTELTDPKEQLERFESEAEKRRDLGRYNHPIDKGFIEALQYGLEPCAGIAVGFERLAMIFANVTSIKELKLIQVA